MCVCIYIYIYIYIYTYTHTHVYVYIYIYIYTHVRVSLSLYIYIYTHIHIYIYIYIYIHTHVYVYIYIYIYTCIHIYTYVCVYIYIYIYRDVYTHTPHVYAYIRLIDSRVSWPSCLGTLILSSSRVRSSILSSRVRSGILRITLAHPFIKSTSSRAHHTSYISRSKKARARPPALITQGGKPTGHQESRRRRRLRATRGACNGKYIAEQLVQRKASRLVLLGHRLGLLG